MSVAAVSAVDDVNDTVGSDDVISDSLESDYQEDVSLSVEEVQEDLSASQVTINSGNYNTYFDSNGKYKGDSSDLVFSGSFSGKNFTFEKPVTISGTGSSFSDSIFTLLSGASGSTVSNLKITNNKDWTYGIFLNSASNCIIKDCTITNVGKSSYPICLGNGANYNNVTGNALKTSGADYGHGTRSTPTLLVSGSHHNILANNTMEVDDANAIYLSSYNGGPLAGGDSNYNLILNNTVHYNVLPTSWSYSIQIMGSYNTIKANKVIGAYRGITTSGIYNTITENWIINLTGADYNNNKVAVGGEFAIVGSAHSTVTKNHIVNAKIISTGAGISVIDSSVVEDNDVEVISSGMGISASGYDVIVRNNRISTESGVGIHEKDDGSGLLVTGNNIVSSSGIGILIEKISSKRMPSNVTITFNDITTGNSFAIDASGVEEGTGIIEDNNIHGKKIKDPSGVHDASRPSYRYNESKTYDVNESNFGEFINANGNLIGPVEDGAILRFNGTFSNQVIYVNKAIKILGINAKFLNSTFKVTSGGVWIENLTIINKDASRLNAWGIYVNGAPGVKIIKNNIYVNDPNAAYAVYVLESSYVEVIGNNLSSDGKFLTYTLLSYSSEECIFANNTINTLGTGERYRYSPESSIEGTIYNVNGTEVCVDGSTVCIDGVTYCIDGNEVCIDGKVYCLDGDVLVVDGERYTISENRTVCIDGNVYCVDGSTVCIDGVTYCLDGSTVCIDGNELVYKGNRYPIVDNNVAIGNQTYCIDGSTNTVCIDGVTYCLDGNVVCIDGNQFIYNGVRYDITENNTVCLDGNVYCLDGSTVCIDGNVYSLNTTVVCIDGNDLVYNGVKYPISEDNTVLIGNQTYCIDGSTNTVCIDGVTYCLDGDVIYINGTIYCLDGNELFVDGSSYGKTNHMVPEIYRTYGILLLYSSFNEVSGNNVTVNSKLDKIYPTTGANASENSIVGIDIYYNSHNNTVSNNHISINAKDNYIYGVGVLGYQTGHAAPTGQGASNNKFIGNDIKLVGPYSTTGIIIGQSSDGTVVSDNTVQISSDITYGVNLEGSHETALEGNDFNLTSQVAYGIEGFNSNDNIIDGNKISANAKQVYGMVISGNNNNIVNNDIMANGTGEKPTFADHDSFGSGNAGIYLFGNATNNIVKSNNITSQKGFAVLIASSGNTIEDNYLISEKGNSNAAINTTSENTIKNNYQYTISGAFESVVIPYLGSGFLVLNVQTPDGSSLDGALVSFYDSYGNLMANVTVSEGKARLKVQLDDGYSVYSYALFKAKVYKEDFKVSEFETDSFSHYVYVDLGNLNVVVSDVSAKETLNGKFTATVTNDLGQPVSGLTVKFYNSDVTLKQAWGTATTDANGVATIIKYIDPYFEEGFGKVTHITAIVQETDYYAQSNGTGLLTIIDIAPVTININSKVGFGGVLATLTDNNGLAVANKQVSVNVNGKNYNVNTNANGQVILPSVSAGSPTITITSPKDSNYDVASASAKVTVVAPITGNKNVNVYFGNTAQYKIRVADKRGNYLSYKAVTIKVNGKNVNLKTDANGYATYAVKKVGTYTITAELNGQKVSNKIVIKPTLIAKNVVKKKAKKIKFTVKLVNKKGKVLKNKKITIKVKNKKYNVKTNKKGIATLTLKKLKVGKYTVKSSYGGCTISNTIKIKK